MDINSCDWKLGQELISGSKSQLGIGSGRSGN